ncbi:methyltransferase [Undibacterium sp. TS12]|uniref:methyltransferase n=1 Tax=Undibacterium sp. TS12 TaxID=2908202 RepID=UPI001F4C88FC|nr:methyltransferase [Undibacterium sp. TS12]MCH8622131.1 methyltransferase [Undibacterium sp. TS12]
MNSSSPSPTPELHWIENDQARSCRWHSESGAQPPKRVQLADDRMNVETAYKFACEGTALLWRGDYHNAKQLLQAMARRMDKKPGKAAKKGKSPASATEAFHLHRQAQSQRARVLAMLLIPFEADYRIPLRRAPDVSLACQEVYGEATTAFVASLRELLGLIGAHEWRKNGVEIATLGAKIHPYYGVFSPVRGEYLDLLANAPLPSTALAFDIGAGTGVLSALLIKRGINKVVATDQDRRALACAQDNLNRLGMSDQVTLLEADLFPPGRAPLVVCNPPWLPARPNSPIEYAVYDPDSRMLRGFLAGVAAHLEPQGEAWLIMSDFAEHLGLRSASDLPEWIAAGGLIVAGKLDIKPRHPKSTDENDPLHAARVKEITSLWRLKLK